MIVNDPNSKGQIANKHSTYINYKLFVDFHATIRNYCFFFFAVYDVRCVFSSIPFSLYCEKYERLFYGLFVSFNMCVRLVSKRSSQFNLCVGSPKNQRKKTTQQCCDCNEIDFYYLVYSKHQPPCIVCSYMEH